MSDLVKHLRAGAADGAHPLTLLSEAADEIDALRAQLDEARAELAHLRQMEELLIARSNRMQTERDALRATVARQSEALKCANSALTECEAILGGEYGDHYGTLINTMLDLREKIAALAAKGETWPAPTC